MELKALLRHLKSQVISNYFVANVSNLTHKVMYNKNIDPFVGTDDEFKRRIIEDVITNIDDVQVVEVVNVESDIGSFSKIE
jgi:hypothetical protein